MQEKYVIYPAVFSKETEAGYENYYNVSFPDIPAANTYGVGLKEATYNAWESLGLNLYDRELPEATALEAVIKEEPTDIVQYVGVDLKEYAQGVVKSVPKVKKNTSIPADLANEAESLGINFSAVLTRALYKEIREIKELSKKV